MARPHSVFTVEQLERARRDGRVAALLATTGIMREVLLMIEQGARVTRSAGLLKFELPAEWIGDEHSERQT